MSKLGIKFVDGGKVFCIDALVEDGEYNIGDKVVVESVRGMEIAEICVCKDTSEQEEVKTILRLATDNDFKKLEEFKKQEKKVLDITNQLIKKYELNMKLVDVSFTLDGSKVIINYICEDRVDFRDLVKDLASQLRIRIELRQIGIRDQAKKLGGIGFCGKECCCKKYLNDFDKVSIKMAKTQGLSLNPTKISGICGRLMCCLSYENDLYAEISSKMPKLNSKVKTKDGVGIVVYNNILKSAVTVKIEADNEVKVNEYDLADLEILPRDNNPQPKKADPKPKNPNMDKKQTETNENKNSQEEKEPKNPTEKHGSNKKNFKKFKNKK